ncbi:1509_t:CDS:2, partial [Racocetra persica]
SPLEVILPLQNKNNALFSQLNHSRISGSKKESVMHPILILSKTALQTSVNETKYNCYL